MKVTNLIGVLSMFFFLVSILSAVIGWDRDYVRYPFDAISFVGIFLSIASIILYLILSLIIYLRGK